MFASTDAASDMVSSHASLNAILNNFIVDSIDVTVCPTCTDVLQLRTGKVNSFGWLRYSGFVRHKEPLVDAVGALADLLVFTFNLTGLDILHKIEAQDTSW